jgi:Ketosteroid isomerase homolog
MKRMLGMVLTGLLLAAPGWAQKAGTAEQELLNLERQWKEAVVKKDVAALQRLYADDYISVDSEGAIWNKTEDIEIDTSGQFNLESFRLEDMKVRTYGDAAVVTGRIGFAGHIQEGIKMSRQLRFSDVFVKQNGQWRCVSNQFTSLATVP